MEYSSSFSSSSDDHFYDASDLEAGYSDDREKASFSYTEAPNGRRGYSLFCEPCDADKEPPHHFLDTCFFCKKLLSVNRDIFMYRQKTRYLSIYISMQFAYFQFFYDWMLTALTFLLQRRHAVLQRRVPERTDHDRRGEREGMEALY